MKKNIDAFLPLVAVSLGVFGYFLSSAVFVFAVFGIIMYFIYRMTPDNDRRFVLNIMVYGFLLRVILSVVLHASNYVNGYHGISGDDLLYMVKSWAMVYKWAGEPYRWVNDISGSSLLYGVNPFSYLLAVFYKTFGFHPVSSKLISCAMGTLAGWIAYLTARDMFDAKAGRIAMAVVTFYPSLVRWSVANLKDPFEILLFMAVVYFCVSISLNRMRLWQVVAPVLAVILLLLFPQKAKGALALSMIMAASALRYIKRPFMAFFLSCAAAIIVLSYFVLFKPQPIIDILYKLEKLQLLSARSDYAGYYMYTASLLRNLNAGVVSILDLCDVVFRNVAYFLLTPFPWQMTSKERMLALPQMIVWYPILLLSFAGLIRLAMDKCRIAVVLGSSLAIGICFCAMIDGNIGSAFRHRDFFTPLFIILAAGALQGVALSGGPGTQT